MAFDIPTVLTIAVMVKSPDGGTNTTEPVTLVQFRVTEVYGQMALSSSKETPTMVELYPRPGL